MVRSRDIGFRLGTIRKTAVVEKLAGRSLAMDGHPADLPRRHLPAGLCDAGGSALLLFIPAAGHDSHTWPRFTIFREENANRLGLDVDLPAAIIVACTFDILCWILGSILGEADG